MSGGANHRINQNDKMKSPTFIHSLKQAATCGLFIVLLFTCISEVSAQLLSVTKLDASTSKGPDRSMAAGDFDGDNLVDLVTQARSDLGMPRYFGVNYQSNYGLQVHLANKSDSLFFPLPDQKLPVGMAVIDANSDHNADLIYVLSDFLSGTSTVYLAMQKTYTLPRGSSGLPLNSKIIANPGALGAQIASQLMVDGDLTRLFSEIGSSLLPPEAQAILRSVIGYSNTRSASAYYTLTSDSFVFLENGPFSSTWQFVFSRNDLRGAPLRLEVKFESVPNSSNWVATRCTMYFPPQSGGAISGLNRIAVGKLPGNTHPDLIGADAWYEWVTPNAGTQPGQSAPWEFTLAKRQTLLQSASSLEDPILINTGITWQLFSLTPSRRIQVRNFSDGQFTSATEITPSGLMITEFTLGDMNADQLPDLVFATDGNFPNNKVSLSLNTNGGSFSQPREIFTLQGSCQDIKTIDFDRDGKRDIVLADYLPGILAYDTDVKLVVARGLGDNNFATPTYFKNVFYFLDEILVSTFETTGGERLSLQTKNAIVSRPDKSGTMQTTSEVYLVKTSNLPVTPPMATDISKLRLGGLTMNSLEFLPSGRLGFLLIQDVSDQSSQLTTNSIYFGDRDVGSGKTSGLTLLASELQSTQHLILLRGADQLFYAFIHTDTGLDQLVYQNAAWTNVQSLEIQGDHVTAAAGPDGSFHFVFFENVNFEEQQYHLKHARLFPNGNLVKETVATDVRPISVSDMSDFDDLIDYGAHQARNLGIAIDTIGNPHVIFSRGRFQTPIISGGKTIGTEVRSSLNYATKTESGVWQQRTILQPPSGQFGDYGGLGASIAIAPNGSIGVAASIMPRARTGSPGVASLVYTTITGNEMWRVVDSASAGYVMADGNLGTGLFPNLAFDGSSMAHIVYTDHAGQHFQDRGSKSFSGQVRYARQSPGAGWLRWTPIGSGGVIPMDSQIFHPALAVRSDGTAVIAANSYRWSGSRSSWTRTLEIRTIAAHSIPRAPVAKLPVTSSPEPVLVVDPIQQQIDALMKQIRDLRKKVKNPVARANRMRALNRKLNLLRRQQATQPSAMIHFSESKSIFA